MAKISGVSVELITKLAGVRKALVRKIGSKLTAELGFGPNYNPGPTCETLSMSYSSVSLADAVNNGTGINVELGDNGIWYAEGSCGNFTAGTGYYFLDDGNREVFYFYWDAETEELSELEAPADGPTCETVTSFYSAVSLWDAYDAGIETTIEIGDNGIWYLESSCGGDFATTGYYVIEGRRREFFYYFWDASAQTLTELEAPQPPVVGPTNTIAPTLNIMQPAYVPTYATGSSRGTWTGTGDITYTYEWYVNDNLIATQGPYPSSTYDPKSGQYNITDLQPSWQFTSNTNLFDTFYLKVTATDDNGSTSVSTSPITIQDATLNTFLTNTGINNQTKISALQYLRKALLTTSSLDSALKDYYPFVGDTENENKWSLKNPNSYLEFSSGWTHSRDGSTPNGSAFATSTYTGVKTAYQQLWSLGYYTSTNVQESSVDISLVQVGEYSTTKVAEFGARTISNAAFFNTPGNVNTNKTLATPSYSSVGLNLVTSIDFGYIPDFRVVLNGSIADWTANGRMYGNSLGNNYNGYNETFVLGSSISRQYENAAVQYNPLISTMGSTKQYQFAFVGTSVYNYGSIEGLNTIIQTYNSMLGR